MKKIALYLLIIGFAPSLLSQRITEKVKYSDSGKLIKPSLFANLGESCSTPDGMALDNKGHLFLAVTNYDSFEKYGSKILTFTKNDKPVTWYDELPLHPVTKRVHPMGIEFGEDGNLYIADNQSFTGQVNQSRILRVIVENGQPIRSEVLVEGLNFANGIRINNNGIYVTDFSLANSIESGVYAFGLKEINQCKIVLNDSLKSKYLVKKFPAGIDGIAFDKDGNLYVGHFNSGTITKIKLSNKGIVQSQKVLFDSEKLNCVDGMYYDQTRNSIFFANLSNNSVHQLDLNSNTIHLIWINENSNGADGLLDNPCETIIYNGDLIVVSFDTFKGVKNLEVDEFNTMSRIRLSK
jgi:sugar lactone lactonase YvrE